MIFKRNGTQGELPQPITFNGVNIDRIEETRYLGLVFHGKTIVILCLLEYCVALKIFFLTSVIIMLLSFFNNYIHILRLLTLGYQFLRYFRKSTDTTKHGFTSYR